MPRLCAFKCPPSDAPMHRFPNPDKYLERFKSWVVLVGGKLDTVADYEYYRRKRVCDRHFTVQDRVRENRLNVLAVPSLHLSDRVHVLTDITNTMNLPNPSEISGSHTTYSSSIEATCSETVTFTDRVHVLTDITNTMNLPNPSEISGSHTTYSSSIEATCSETVTFTGRAPCMPITLLAEHNYTAASRNKLEWTRKNLDKTPSFNCIQIKNMRTQINNLRSELSRIKKSGKFETRLASATKLFQKTAFHQVVQRMAKPAQLFLNMQLQSSKKPKGRRFTIEEKVLCLSLFKKGPKCYSLLSKYFTLPSAKAMKRLLSQIKLCPGINHIIFEKIKNTLSEKDAQDRLCSLAFDEMSLEAQVHYNMQKDTLEGFSCNKGDEFANHALVFMVKGVKQNFKQPIAYYFTNTLNSVELKKMIKTVIRHAQDSGLIIVNTVCDQSTVNVSAINDLINETRTAYLRRGKEWRHDCFTVNGWKIIPLYDTPHLIKGIRNNLLTKDMLYSTNGEEKKVKWDYYQRAYHADKSYGNLKLLHKITEEHIDPVKINKMRVKTATQIFSHSVAVVTEHLTARGDLPVECRNLIDITLLLNDLFDSLNVNSLKIPDGKMYKGAIKINSPHHKLWCEAKQILKTVKFIQKKTNGNKIRFIETTVPSITNLIKTIEAMEAIWNVLSKRYGLDAMLTRNFNQDPVENFFGNIRSYGVRNIRPNTVAFEGAFKALLLNNYITPHSKKANCEEDYSECLQNLDFFLKENCSFPEEASDIAGENIILNEDLFESGNKPKEDAGQRNYVCGWVLTKCLKHICKSCQQCRQSLLGSNENNAYTKAKEYNKKKWLCYPSDHAVNCFHDIQTVTSNFLKNNIPKKNIKKTITQFCEIFIEYPFKCSTHKEALKKYFTNITINVLIFSWCRTINRILSGKTSYEGEEEVKKKAVLYYNKYKNYKNKK